MQSTLETTLTKASLVDRFREVRSYTMQLVEPLNTEDFVPQAAEFVSPPKWHLAHTTWFFEEFVLKAHAPNYREFNPRFSFLFNSYYNTIGERTVRTDRGIITRPTVDEVNEYRKYVDEQLAGLIIMGVGADVEELITIGLHHEQQHQELLITDMKYMFGKNPMFPVITPGQDRLGEVEKTREWLSVEGGIHSIGHEGDGFCYDNELGRHKVHVDDFDIAKHLVTNGDYLLFMEAEGYETFDYWLDQAWAWVKDNEVCSPLYWHRIDGQWMQYTLDGLKPVDVDAPLCHVSYYEADAYARWSGHRLPTEAEWEIAALGLNWGQRWEWTGSAYLPYPGFKKAPGALGEYNGKFMIDQMVLRGGSTATSEGHSRITYRNFFQAAHQWQFTGVRLVRANTDRSR